MIILLKTFFCFYVLRSRVKFKKFFKQMTFYPDSKDINKFTKSLLSKYEFTNLNLTGQLRNYQVFLRNFLNPNTPYTSLLLYHSTGSGKTLTSISILLQFLGKIKIFIFIKNKLLEKNFKQQIKQFYGDIKLPNLHFVSINTLNSKTNVDFSNSLIIIDEVQNVINNNIYTSLMKIKDKSKNLRILLLTATPMFDNVSEIFEISNLLNDLNNQLPIRNELIKKKYLYEPSEYKQSKNFFLSGGNVLFLTEKGKKIIQEKLLSKISYIKVDTSTKEYPSSIIQGTKFKQDKLVFCKMPEIQDKIYTDVLTKNKDVLYQLPSYLSIIGVLPSKINNSYFKKENIKLYSSKLYQLLKNINLLKNKQGTIFIYSNYVKDSGVSVIIRLLKENGYSYYNNFKPNQNSFVYFNDKITEKKKQEILTLFNSPKNKNGDYIKIFIGSPMTSEGVNFKHIRQLHIMDPYWNYSKMQQIIGRAIRFKSHEFLLAQNNNVKIYKYASIPSSKNVFSIDLFKYELAIEKDRAIKDVEYMLKKIAIDCSMFKTVLPVKYNYTRDCEYKKCNFTCSNEISEKLKPDYSTYNFIEHNKEEYNFIHEELLKLFKSLKILTLKQLESHFSSKINYLSNLYITLTDLIDKELITFNGKYYSIV